LTSHILLLHTKLCNQNNNMYYLERSVTVETYQASGSRGRKISPASPALLAILAKRAGRARLFGQASLQKASLFCETPDHELLKRLRCQNKTERGPHLQITYLAERLFEGSPERKVTSRSRKRSLETHWPGRPESTTKLCKYYK